MLYFITYCIPFTVIFKTDGIPRRGFLSNASLKFPGIIDVDCYDRSLFACDIFQAFLIVSSSKCIIPTNDYYLFMKDNLHVYGNFDIVNCVIYGEPMNMDRNF